MPAPPARTAPPPVRALMRRSPRALPHPPARWGHWCGRLPPSRGAIPARLPIARSLARCCAPPSIAQHSPGCMWCRASGAIAKRAACAVMGLPSVWRALVSLRRARWVRGGCDGGGVRVLLLALACWELLLAGAARCTQHQRRCLHTATSSSSPTRPLQFSSSARAGGSSTTARHTASLLPPLAPAHPRRGGVPNYPPSSRTGPPACGRRAPGAGARGGGGGDVALAECSPWRTCARRRAAARARGRTRRWCRCLTGSCRRWRRRRTPRGRRAARRAAGGGWRRTRSRCVRTWLGGGGGEAGRRGGYARLCGVVAWVWWWWGGGCERLARGSRGRALRHPCTLPPHHACSPDSSPPAPPPSPPHPSLPSTHPPTPLSTPSLTQQAFSDDEELLRDTTARQLADGRDVQGIPWVLTQYTRAGYRVSEAGEGRGVQGGRRGRA